MKNFFLLTFCALTLLSCAQDNANLIPRKTLFTANANFDYRLSPDGEFIYFRNQSTPNTVHVLQGDSESIIELPEDPYDWWPVNNGLLCITSYDSLPALRFWNGINWNKLDLIEGITELRVLERDKYRDNKWILYAESDDDAVSGLYVFDASTSTMTKKYELQSLWDLRFDQDLNLIAGMGRGDQGSNALFVWSDYGEWEKIEDGEWDETQFLGGFRRMISVSNDGDRIYFNSNNDRDKYALYEYERSSGESNFVLDSDKADLLPFAHTPSDDGSPGVVVALYAESLHYYTDQQCQQDYAFLKENIPGDISFLTSSADNQTWLIREMLGAPSQIYKFNRANRNLELVNTEYPSLKKYKMAKRKAFEVKSRDGLNLPVHVYLPEGSDANGDGIPDKPLPTVMYVHGGPWAGVVHWNQYFHWRNFQLLANRGYAVINCEFRGSTGLGKDFVSASDKEWGGAMTNDKKDIADWAVEMGIAKKDKLCLWGWSYGGYAALAGAAFYPETYNSVISMYGPTDLLSFTQLPFTDNQLWRNRVGDYRNDQEAEMLKKHSPYYHVENINVPVLMTTGSLDERVPQEQMDIMAEALVNAGKECKYIVYPKEVHDYLYSDSWVSFWSFAEEFLKENLGGRMEADNGDRLLAEHELVYE